MFDASRVERVRAAWWLTLILLAAGLAPVVGQEAPTEEEPPAESSAAEIPQVEDVEAAVAPEPPEPETPAEPEITGEPEGIEPTRRTVTKDTQVHFMSDLVIGEDEAAREAVAILGDVVVYGTVRGDAVAVMGSVTVRGEVLGTVTAIGDDVRLEAGAEVMGDVVSVGGRVEADPTARVLGEISEVDFGPAMTVSGGPFAWRFDEPHFWDMWHLGVTWDLFWTFTKWILLFLITAFILLVARGPVERVRRAVEEEFWKAGLVGLATWLLLFPVLLVATVILAISIIGIPLLLILWPLAIFALLIACFVGFTATAYALGSWLGRRFGRRLTNPYLAMLLGIVAIQLLSFVAELLGGIGGPIWFFVLMFGLVGWLVRFAAWTLGLGGAILAFADRGRAMPPPVPPTAPSPAGTGAAGSTTGSPTRPPEDEVSAPGETVEPELDDGDPLP